MKKSAKASKVGANVDKHGNEDRAIAGYTESVISANLPSNQETKSSTTQMENDNITPTDLIQTDNS